MATHCILLVESTRTKNNNNTFNGNSCSIKSLLRREELWEICSSISRSSKSQCAHHQFQMKRKTINWKKRARVKEKTWRRHKQVCFPVYIFIISSLSSRAYADKNPFAVNNKKLTEFMEHMNTFLKLAQQQKAKKGISWGQMFHEEAINDVSNPSHVTFIPTTSTSPPQGSLLSATRDRGNSIEC